MDWKDFFKQVQIGKTLYRTLFQQELFKNSKYIQGKVFDIGSGGNPSYKKYLPKNIELITTDYIQKTGVVTIVDFNKKININDDSVDTVLLFHNLYIAENPWETLKEVFRIVKPGGHVVISNPFGMNIMAEPHDYIRFTKEGLDKILTEQGFTIIVSENVGDRFSLIANTLHAFLLVWPIRLIVNMIALMCDRLIPKGIKKNHPFPIGYFYVIRK
jgi:SAM-dependent methyltransferase